MDEKIYQIGDKGFKLKDDFTYAELEWLDVVYLRIAHGTEQNENKNEVSGNFTREEISKTLCILLEGKDGSKFTHEDFMECKESFSVKIIADFFLQKAILGAFTESVLRN